MTLSLIVLSLALAASLALLAHARLQLRRLRPAPMPDRVVPNQRPAGAGTAEALCAVVFPQMQEGVAVVDLAGGGFPIFNDAACASLGYAREVFSGLSLAKLDAEPMSPPLAGQLGRLLAEGGGVMERRLRHRDGTPRSMRIRCGVLRQPDGALPVLIWRDETERGQLQRELKALQSRHRDAIDGAPVGLAHVTTDGRCLEPNARLCELLGYGRDALRGMALQSLIHPADRHRDRSERRRLFAGEVAHYSVIQQLMRGDGTVLKALVTLSAPALRRGEETLRLVVQELPAQPGAAGAEAERACRRLHEMLESLDDGLILLSPPAMPAAGVGEASPDGLRVLFANGPAGAALARDPEALSGRLLSELFADADSPELAGLLRRVLAGGQPERCAPMRCVGGGDLGSPRRLEPLVLRTPGGELLLLLDDPDKRRALDVALSETRAELELLAYYDPLTRLPNLRLFEERVRQACAQADFAASPLAVCCLDLDGFGAINGRHGQATGDALLCAVAERLEGQLGSAETAGRWSGDEFVLLLTEFEGLAGCDDKVRGIQAALAEPFTIGACTLEVTASVGVAYYPWDRSGFNDLLRHARHAMHLAKESAAGAGCHYFDAEADGLIGARRHNLARIEDSLANDALILRFLPIVDLRQGRVAALEAVPRWQPQDDSGQAAGQGLPPAGQGLPPAGLLPQGAGAHLVRRLDLWLLDHALPQLEAWYVDGLEVRLHVGISVRTLLSDGFADVLRMLLDAYPLVPPGRLLLDLRELDLADDLALLGEALERVGGMGVRFALDDFGAGQQSLARCRALPVELLKIAPTVVRDLPDPDVRRLLMAVAGVADAFNRRMLAADVERTEQAIALHRAGCALIQGAAVAAEIAAADVPDWLRAWAPEPEWLAAGEASVPG